MNFPRGTSHARGCYFWQHWYAGEVQPIGAEPSWLHLYYEGTWMLPCVEQGREIGRFSTHCYMGSLHDDRGLVGLHNQGSEVSRNEEIIWDVFLISL